MSDGVYSGKLSEGIAPQSIEADPLDRLAGSALRFERRRFKGLAVDGMPASIRNRADFTTVYWPNANMAFDLLPARDDTTALPGGSTVGAWWRAQVPRRRAALARVGIAYVVRHAGDPDVTAEDLQAARAFVDQHRDDPPEPEQNPLITRGVTYDEQIANFDPETGVGVRRRED